MPQARLRVEGLADLRRALRKLERVDDLADLREGLKRAADVVARDAKGRVPSRTGRARESIRAVAAGNRALVVGGKARVPYYAWLDFGSRNPATGNPRSVGPWAGTGRGPKGGRFIYPAIDANENEIARLVETAINQALRKLDL